MSISTNAQITLIDTTEAYTILLTNEAQQFPTNSSRVPLSNVSYYTDIVVYQGTTERTDYTIGAISSANNITVSKTSSRITFSVSTASALSADSGTFTIPITIDGKTFNKIFSWSCAKQGITGNAGQNATSYRMIVSNAAIVKSQSGTYSPASITLTGKSQAGTSAMANYSGRFKIFLNGSSTASYTSSANESSKTYTIPADTTSIRCVLYKAGGTSVILDEQTIPVVIDGLGISSTAVTYQIGSSGTTPPTGTWQTSVQTAGAGQYLWTRTITTYSDGSTTTSYSVSRSGNNGDDGRGISSCVTEYQASSSGTTIPTGTWSTTIPTVSQSQYLWTRNTFTYTDNTTSYSYSVGRMGSDGATGTGYTIVLSNESHTFPGSTSTATASTASTNVIAYKNTSQVAATITKIGSSSVSGNASGVATGITGLTASVTNNGTTSCAITFSATTSLTTKSGVVVITMTVDGKTFTKNFSFSLALTGATGTSAKSVDITASSQVFKSTDGGSTFSPDTIKLTPVFQGGISYSKWQYSTNGGSSWTDVSSGSHGLTISSGVLSIAKTSDLFTETVTSISFKCISSNSTYYDIMTVLKLYDVTDIEIGGRNLVKNSNFYMGKSKWGESGVTVNILDDDFYGHVAQIISPNTGSVSFRIYTDINSNFSFEIDVLYTISFYAKADSDCNIQTNIAGGTQSVNHALTTAWERYSYTLTASKTGSLTFWSVSAGTTFYITNIQIEHGNKATDWSPAPEDIQNQITTITDTISGVESKVNANTKSITDKVWQTDISTSINEYDGSTVKSIRNRVTSTETDISGIKTTLSDVQTTVSKKANGSTVQTLSTKVATMESSFNGFKTTVSNTYTTKEDFNNLEIGGRNLISNLVSNWQNGSWSIPSVGENSVLNTYNGRISLKNPLQIEPGSDYWVKCYSAKSIQVLFRQLDSNGKFLRSSIDMSNKMWSAPSDCYSVKITVYDNSTIDDILDGTTKLKIEKGNKPTDWSPAPEDVEQSITNVSSQYTQLADKFNWVVKSGTSASDFTITDRMATLVSNYINLKGLVTFSGLDSTAQSKITTAQNTADSAKTSASNAQSTANSAVTKADNAQTTANTAKTNAATAQSTANSAKTAAANAQSKADSLGVVHMVDGKGNTNMYIHFATISTTHEYLNYTISFRVISRAYEASNVQIQFVSQDAADPNISYFRANGDVPLYMVKSATSTWYVIMKKNEPYGNCVIDNYYNASGAKVTWVSNHLASLPSGYISSSWLAEGKLAQTVKSTVDNGKSNWDTAYSWTNTNGSNMTSLLSMVKKWTNNAVSDTTTINGGWISTNTITASQIASRAIITSKLATDAIKSTNYSYSSGNFSSAGTFLDLSTGLIRSKNFAIDSSGNAYFKGNIQANAGYIGGTSGWSITTNTITGNANSKIISGILESSNYVENSTGVQVNLNTGIIKGNIEASTLAAKEAIKIYVGSTKRNVITGHLASDFFYVRIGCDLSTSNIARVKPSIILNKSTASTNVSDMITINTSALDIEANTSIVGSLSASDISTYTNGGAWISGKRSAAINILTSQSEGAFHPVLRISSYSGNVWCLGGLGDTVGIYGYYSGRTANGYDWCTTWDTSNGNLTTTNNINCNDVLTRTGWAADRLSHGQTAYSNLMSGRISFKWVQNSSGVWRFYVYVDDTLVRDW